MKKLILFTFSLVTLTVFAVFAQKPEALIGKASVVPVIDGVMDEVWAEAEPNNITGSFAGTIPTLGEPGETYWKALWNEDGFYLIINVTDDAYFPNYAVSPAGNPWDYDLPEVYFDVNYVLADGVGPGFTGSGHHQVAPALTLEKENGMLNIDPVTGVTHSIKVTNPNYIAEYFVPWNWLKDKEGIIVDLTGQIGFDITINDSDPENEIRRRAVWANDNSQGTGEAWVNMDECGIIMLEDTEPNIGIESITLTGGTITTDNGTIQIAAEILPEDASIKQLIWSVAPAEGSTGLADISSTGLLSAKKDGIVTVTALAMDGSFIEATVNVTISGQVISFDDVNIIMNGNFDLIGPLGVPNYWGGWIETGYGDTWIVVDGVAVLNVTQSAQDPWYYQFSQTNLKALSNVPYEISFIAWSDVNRSITFDFEDTSENSYNRYGISSDPESLNGKSEWKFNISTEPTRYTFHTTFTEMVPSTIQKISFMLSHETGIAYLDSISLISEDDYALLHPVDISEITVLPDFMSAELFTGDTLIQQITIDNSNGSNSFSYTITKEEPTESLKSGRIAIGFYAERPDYESNTTLPLVEINALKSASLINDKVLGSYSNFINYSTGMVYIDEYIYAINYNNQTLVKYDVLADKVISTFPIHSSPYGIAFDGTYLWIGSSNGNVYGYNFSGELIGSFSLPFGEYPALTFNGINFLASQAFSNSPVIYEVNYSGNTIKTYSTSSIGVQFYQFTWVSEHIGGNLWLNAAPNQKIYQINLEGNEAVSVISFDFFDNATSYSIAHDGKDLLYADWDGPLFRIDDGIIESNWLTFKPKTGTLAIGATQNINVKFDAKALAVGDYNANIAVTLNRLTEPSFTIPVFLNVNAATDITTYPKNLDFGHVLKPEIKTMGLTIQNIGSDTLKVSNITVSKSCYTVDNTKFNLLPMTSKLINVTFNTVNPGIFKDNLTVFSNDKDHPEYIVPLNSESVFIPCNSADSLALAALYNAANGSNWNRKDNWLNGYVQNWYGVKLNQEGRVSEINLVRNGLNGHLPTEVGNLTGLQKLQLGNQMFNVTNGSWNNLNQQPLPQTLVNLTNLQILSLDQLSMNSEIPDMFSGMTVLRELYIQENYFTNNSLPAGIISCSSLEVMNIAYNNFYICPDLSGLNNLIQVNAYGCYFSFEDIEPNLWIPNFSYYYQRLILGNPETLNPTEGETFTRTIEVGGENNIYQWLKDGQELSGQTTNTLTLENVGTAEAGIYTLRVSNSLATQLTLGSHPIILYQNQLPVYLALEALYNSTGGDNWWDNTNWLTNQPFTRWRGIYMDNGQITLDLWDNNLIGKLPDEFGDLSVFNQIAIQGNPGLTGEIPSSIGQLTNLQYLHLYGNNLSGSIPDEIVNCTNLLGFGFDNNQITGLPDLSEMNNLYWINAINNKLEFDDIIPNIEQLDYFEYSPQKKYGEVESKLLVIGSSVTFNGLAGGGGNNYQWYKNNEPMQGQTGSELIFASLTSVDEGTYTCYVTNPSAPNLTLVSEPKSLYDASNLDAYEPDNYFAYVQEITGVDYQQHSLFPAGDRDIAWFEITQPSEVKVWMSNGEWGSRQLTVYDTDTTTILASGSDYVSFFVIEPGIYYVKAWSQNSEVISEYFLDIEITPVTIDSYEPDNNWADAKQIYPFFPQDDHNLKPYNDADFVKFEIVDAPRTVKVDVFNETQCRQFSLWLYGTDGVSELAYADWGAKNCGARIEYNIPSNGTYYVKTKVPWQEMYDYYTLSVITDGQPPVVKCNEQDSLALVAIYNATNGPNWGNKTNWLTGNVQTWYGVTMNIEGRVNGLNLASNRLNGYIPAAIGNLTEMKKLVLGNYRYRINTYGSNTLSQQPLPQTLENLTKLEILALDEIYMNNELPDVFEGMTTLRELYISYSYFNNQALPAGISLCSNLEILYIQYNNFYDLPDLSGLAKLSNLQASGCYFSFEDIEPNLVIPNFYYSGQRLILGTPESLIPASGETITRTYSVGGANNIYQWLKDGYELAGQNSNTLTLENVSTVDAGIYTLRITNSLATQLILTSHPIILYQNQLPIYQALEAFYNGTGGVNWNNNNNWLSDQPVTTWYGINLSTSNGLINLSLNNNNLVGTLPSEFGDLSIFYQIQISNNPGLTGEIPASVGQLTNLQYLYLHNNNLTGVVPSTIGQLTNLQYLYLYNNKLSGSLPPEIGNMAQLFYFDIYGNQIEYIPDEITNCSNLRYFHFNNNKISDLPNLEGMDYLYRVYAHNNKLEFDDIVPIMGQFSQFQYAPQDSIGESMVITKTVGENLNYTLTTGGDQNQYQWFKDGELLDGKTSATLEINNLTIEDSGNYLCQVSNPQANQLILFSRVINLNVEDIAAETQQISLNTGWNIMSLRVIPENANLKDILQLIIDNKTLKKVMDESGLVIENWGVFGEWKNFIGDLHSTEGYKINVTAPVIFEVEGIPAQFPFDIALKTGWNIISWPSSFEQDGLEVFENLIADGKLKKVMDEGGKVIEDYGVYGDWANFIGNLKSGEGYKVNVTEDCILTINEIGTKSEVIIPKRIPSTHFIPAFTGNGNDHMNINLVNLSESGIMEGDEIGVFDGEICVGSVQISNLQSTFVNNQSIFSIPVSASDEIESRNGYSDGNPVTVKLFRNGKEYPVFIEPLSSDKTVFSKGSSLFVELALPTGIEGIIKGEFTDVKIYPNPFSEEVMIELNLNIDAEVQVEVFSQTGQRVKIVTTKHRLQSGFHKLIWNGRNENEMFVSPGIYHLRVVIDDTIIHGKIVYSK